jgi:hypothetical protein
MARYSMDDLHRIEAIVLSARPSGDDFRGAMATTERLQSAMERPDNAVDEVVGALRWFAKKRGTERGIQAVRMLRSVQHVKNSFGGRLNAALSRRLGEVVRTVKPHAAVVVPADLLFSQ